MIYTIEEVPLGAATQLEQLGTKKKFWFDRGDGKYTLFKQGRPGTGEDWAEKACCEVARLIGLPHADYELSTHADVQGVVSPTFVPSEGRLAHGNELLSKVYDYYEENRNYGVSQHTVRRVLIVLRTINPPIGWPCPPEVKSAAGAFVGYLMLDTLVGNQDRHHENWGAILQPGQELFLAPTFDHAASLGRNENDEARIERLSTRDKGRSVEHYVTRARSALFKTPADKSSLSTLEAFTVGGRLEKRAAQWWLRRLADVPEKALEEIIDRIPDSFISEPARLFAQRMLTVNRKRLLAEEGSFK